jgi:hypothetical protein
MDGLMLKYQFELSKHCRILPPGNRIGFFLLFVPGLDIRGDLFVRPVSPAFLAQTESGNFKNFPRIHVVTSLAWLVCH